MAADRTRRRTDVLRPGRPCPVCGAALVSHCPPPTRPTYNAPSCDLVRCIARTCGWIGSRCGRWAQRTPEAHP